MSLHPALRALIKEQIDRLNDRVTEAIKTFEAETGLHLIGFSLQRLPSKDPANRLMISTQFKTVF